MKWVLKLTHVLFSVVSFFQPLQWSEYRPVLRISKYTRLITGSGSYDLLPTVMSSTTSSISWKRTSISCNKIVFCTHLGIVVFNINNGNYAVVVVSIGDHGPCTDIDVTCVHVLEAAEVFLIKSGNNLLL